MHSNSTTGQLRLYSQVKPGKFSRIAGRKVTQAIRDLGPKEPTADSPTASTKSAPGKPTSYVLSGQDSTTKEKSDAVSPELTKTQKRNIGLRERRKALKQGLEAPKGMRGKGAEKPQRQENVLRREARIEARKVRSRIRLTNERSRLIMNENGEAQQRKEEYDAMPRFEQGNVMRSAARRILRASKSEMGMQQISLAAGELPLVRARREEVNKLKESMRRDRQRMAKKEAQLEQILHGQRVTNKVIDRRIQGIAQVDARFQNQQRNEQSYSQNLGEVDMPLAERKKQDWPEATKEIWADDSFMDMSLARKLDSVPTSPPANRIPTRKAFSNVQAQAVEQALAGTAVLSSKERRHRFFEEVITPSQERNVQNEVGKSAAQIAIGKFARTKARIADARNSDIRYVAAVDPPIGRQPNRRSYYTEARTNRIDDRFHHQTPFASQVQPTKSPAIDHSSALPIDEQADSANHEAPIIDSDVFYRAFKEVFSQGRSKVKQLVGAQRENEWTLEDRQKRRKVVIETAEPSLEIWDSLILRWRLEVWHAAVGLTEDEIEDVGQVTIRRQTLARVVANMTQRFEAGRPRLRDDPLWREIIHGQRVKDKEDLDRFGLDEEDAFVWWHVRTKSRAHSGSATPLSSTRRQMAKMAVAKKQNDRVFSERMAAISSRAEKRLQEWKHAAENIHRELWLTALGVHDSNEPIRRLVSDERALRIDEVRAAMIYWRSARDRGRAPTRLYDGFFMMERKFAIGEEGSLTSRLRFLRQFILERPRRRSPVRDKHHSLERTGDPSTARFTQPASTPLLNDEYSAERHLAALKRRFTKLTRQIEDVKLDLFSIVTGIVLEDSKTMQYISMPTLRLAIKTSNQVNSPALPRSTAENAVILFNAAQKAYGRLRRALRRRERKPLNVLLSKLRVEVQKAEEKKELGPALRLEAMGIARRYHRRMFFWASEQLKWFNKHGVQQTLESYRCLIEQEKKQMIDVFVQCGLKPEKFVEWGTHHTWEGSKALRQRVHAGYVRAVEYQEEEVQRKGMKLAFGMSVRRLKYKIRSRIAVDRITRLRTQVRARAALENKREGEARSAARVATLSSSAKELSSSTEVQPDDSATYSPHSAVSFDQQANQQTQYILAQQLKQNRKPSNQETGTRKRRLELIPIQAGIRRLPLTSARSLKDAILPRQHRNVPGASASAAGTTKRSKDPSGAPQSASDGLIPVAALKRFNKGKARYIAQLEAAERSFAPADRTTDNTVHEKTNDNAVYEDSLFDGGLFDFPHEADTPNFTNTPTFSPSKRLLAPLSKAVDIGEHTSSKADPPKQGRLTHLNSSGEARMVSVAAKRDTKRVAIAVGRVCFSNDETHKLVTSAALKKGDVLAISRIAGIQAAKMCPSIIPLCHPIMISSVKVDVIPFKDDQACGIYLEGMVECTGPTGVEMEALTTVMGAALTVIDMVKAVDKSATIEGVKVVHKSGGKSGTWVDEEWQASRK